MTDLYTDSDLRAEAARQLANAFEDPDFVGIGEQMWNSRIPSTVTDPDAAVATREGGRTWDMLAEDDFEAAQNAIDVLINGAADVSEWAVALGAAGLFPHEPYAVRCTTGGYAVAVQIATHPDITDETRDRILTEIQAAVHVVVARTLGCTPVT